MSFQNVSNITDPASNLAEVNGVALIFWDIFEAKYGSGTGAVFLLLIPLGCGVFCGLHSITSASRYLFESCMFGNSAILVGKVRFLNACLTTMVLTPMRPMIVAQFATRQTAHIRLSHSLARHGTLAQWRAAAHLSHW